MLYSLLVHIVRFLFTVTHHFSILGSLLQLAIGSCFYIAKLDVFLFALSVSICCNKQHLYFYIITGICCDRVL